MTNIEELIPQNRLHHFPDYDRVIPLFVDELSITYDLGSKHPFPVHVGHGTFGDVFRVRFIDDRYKDLRVCIKEFCSEETDRHEVIEETRKLLHLSDTGCVPLCFGIVEIKNNISGIVGSSFGILQEFIGDGLTLQKFLRQSSTIEKSTFISIAFQLAMGLDKFHDKHILVNDIKSNNVVMYKNRNGYRIKYIDFGLATYKMGRKFTPICENLKKLKHLAPEVRNGRITTKASDVYSLGCIMRQICFFGSVKDLILISHMCTRVDPSRRLTAHTTKILIENIVDQ